MTLEYAKFNIVQKKHQVIIIILSWLVLLAQKCWWSKNEVQSQNTFESVESGNIRLGIMCCRFIWSEGPTILTDHQTLTQKPTLGLCIMLCISYI